MKYRFLFASLFLVLFSCAFTILQERVIKQNSFGTGEYLEYKVHYGFISAAEAVVKVDNNVQFVNKRPCFKVEVQGRTVGAFDFISRVRDTWRTHIDTISILPQAFYEKKQEKDYRMEESVLFDHYNNSVSSVDLSSIEKEKKTTKVPDNVQDLISSYYYIRTLDFTKMKDGEVVGAKVYYENEIMDLKMRFRGRDKIKTKFGYANCYKISPIVPGNKFFSGAEPIKIWVSDDSGCVPLKVEVSLAIGTLVMDLKKFSGLKSNLSFAEN